MINQVNINCQSVSKLFDYIARCEKIFSFFTLDFKWFKNHNCEFFGFVLFIGLERLNPYFSRISLNFEHSISGFIFFEYSISAGKAFFNSLNSKRTQPRDLKKIIILSYTFKYTCEN